jgi:trigger factor
VISEKKIERLEHSAVRLTVTVPQAEVAKNYDSMMKEYAKTVHIDGFRKGHVPATVLERKFGDSLRIDAMSRILESAVEEAIKDSEDKPLSYRSPELDGSPDFALDKDFTFSVSYDVYPVVTSPDWKGIEITLPQIEVGKEDEDREIARIRDANSIVVEKNGVAAKGDVVTVDYSEVDAEGVAVEGSSRQDFTFEIGTGYNLYKFDDEIRGMARDEVKLVEKTFPADYEYDELAGRNVKLSVKLTKIKEKKLPDLDDEFAQDVSEKYSTFADLLASVRAGLEKNLENRMRQMKEEAITGALLARTTVDLPATMVDAEIAMRWENMKRQMGVESDEKMAQIASYSGKTREGLKEEWRPSAEKSIATRLLLDKLVEDGKYQCSDEELEAELQRQAAESNVSVDEIRAEYTKRASMEYIRERIKEDKLFADILAAATVGVGKRKAYMDVVAENE